MRYPEHVKMIIDRLEERGFEAYIVGGSVRDMLLSKEPHDYDVTTSAKPHQMLDILSDMRTIPTGLKHGTLTVMSHGEPIEVTTFRIDGEYLDSRRPESVSFTDDVTADLSRRDFTVNAMAFSEKRGIIDVFGGREDLEKRIIRAVGDPKERFSEDALRIMRAFRFASQLGFSIEEKTLLAAEKLAGGLSRIAKERIAAEFIRTICNNTVSTVIKLMEERGILGFVIGDCKPSQKILSALERAEPLPHIRLGILLSELGKERAGEVLRSLKLSNKMISDVKRIVGELGTGLEGGGEEARRFLGRVGENAEDVMKAAEALGVLDASFADAVREAIAKKECATIGSLAIHGGEIVRLGAVGREVGDILEYLLAKVISDPKLNQKDTLTELARAELERLNGEKNG